MIFNKKLPAQEKFQKSGQNLKLVDLSRKKYLLLKALSYFENGTQLLVFRNEILAHLSKFREHHNDDVSGRSFLGGMSALSRKKSFLSTQLSTNVHASHPHQLLCFRVCITKRCGRLIDRQPYLFGMPRVDFRSQSSSTG